MKKMHALVIALAAGSILTASLPAEARLGSSGTRSSAITSSARSVAPSVVSRDAPARVGGGNSVGMARADVMAQARAQSGSNSRYYGSVGANSTANSTASNNSGYGYNPSPAYGRSHYDAQPQYSSQPRQGYSGTQMLAAGAGGALAGALVTHALDSNNRNTTTYVQAPGTAYAGGGYNGGQYTAAPATIPAVVPVAATSSGSGFGTVLFTLLALGGLGALAYFLIKKASQGADTPVTQTTMPMTTRNTVADHEADYDLSIARELLRAAPRFYQDIQEANNRGDKDALERMTDNPELLQQLVDSIDSRTEPSRTHVLRVDVMGNEVLGFLKDGASYIGSIHYSATVREGDGAPEEVREVYHFVRNVAGGDWRLAGIEEV